MRATLWKKLSTRFEVSFCDGLKEKILYLYVGYKYHNLIPIGSRVSGYRHAVQPGESAGNLLMFP